MSAIEIRGVERTYRTVLSRSKVHALRGVDLILEEAETCGLVGPNGAGKTTLIKVILGIEPVDAGEIKTGGAANIRFGYVPERPTFYDDLSGYENLLHFARLTQIVDGAERCDLLLGQFGLEGSSKRPVCEYSKGMKQRLALARSLLNQPDMLIMDEPFSGLDPTMKMELRSVILGLKGKEMAILISSHDLEDLEEICGSVAFMREGRIVAKKSMIAEDGAVQSWGVTLTSGHEEVMIILGDLGLLPNRRGKEIIFHSDEKNVPDIVRKINAAGADVVEIKRHHTSLEEIYRNIIVEGRT